MKLSFAFLSLLVATVTVDARFNQKRQQSSLSPCTTNTDCTLPEVCFTYIQYGAPNNFSSCQLRMTGGGSCNFDTDCLPSEECLASGRVRYCGPRINYNAQELDRCQSRADCNYEQQCVDYKSGGVKACIRNFNASAALGDYCGQTIHNDVSCNYNADCTQTGIDGTGNGYFTCTANGRSDVPPAIGGVPYPVVASAPNATTTISPPVANSTATSIASAGTSNVTSTSTASTVAANVTTTSIVGASSTGSASATLITSASHSASSKPAASQAPPVTPVSAPAQSTTPGSSAAAETHVQSSIPAPVQSANVPSSAAAPAQSTNAPAPVYESHAPAPVASTTSVPVAANSEATSAAPATAPSTPVCPPAIDLGEVLQYLKDIKAELADVKNQLLVVKGDVLAIKKKQKA